LGNLLLRIYDWEQASLLKCSLKVDRFEAQLKAVTKSCEHCRTELLTSYLELGSQLRRSDPANGQGALDLFKKPLEKDANDWDALELAGRQALALGLRQHACNYLLQLIEATDSRHPLRHARALRFHAELLHEGTRTTALAAHENLERAIIALEKSDAIDLRARADELGRAHEMLAKVQIALRRFRIARTNVSKAKGYLGDTDSLEELLQSATP
jgi:tetratricopeptide (TPR) repeat protein